MTPFSILFRYISRSFLKCFGVMTLGLYIVIFLFDFAELQRKTASQDFALTTKLSMVFLRIPTFVEQALPFLIFISALYMFWRLNRSSELIIFRAMGISLWKTIFPVALTALFIGGVDLGVINSLSSTMLVRYTQLEKQYLSSGQSDIAVESTGIWLSDSIRGYQVIYRASQIQLRPLKLSGLDIIVLSPQDEFLERIVANSASIQGGKLVLENGWHLLAGHAPAAFQKRHLNTSLTPSKIEKMKLKTITASFWNLPAYIKLLETSGLKSLRYRMYWNLLLAQAFWPAAMVVLAAAFVCRPLRQGRTWLMALSGLACGFFLYFFKDVMFSFGVSGKFPPVIAAWLPGALTLMIGSILVFSQEDG